MICKFCNEEMELDSNSGMEYNETHIYACDCGASCIVHENGEEDAWEEGGEDAY
ncbi:hypothetical protein Sgly_0327 [Syntrophobotulus glycolicus DSM 8271]|uniref:Uncharacterized protein n=1 Tax=Syntrophobotulus glycolicus (strain DSM 8271 / FlGlyR) TaxID=645991 RepID=F0SXE7_SYNGF|nr:hypothetical protein [Syntrophobotulus glycolicus]ADY54693.1 hypothetical protein Sgly_0327 [Syntrophobotulus glycolicus DSM 8271]